MKKIVLATVLGVLWSSASIAAHTGWMATMSPSQELHSPSVSGTNASCVATFRTADDNADVIIYKVSCLGLSEITAIHMHGPADADSESPPIVILYSNTEGSGPVAGIVATGSVRRSIVGNDTFDAFTASLANDSGYVNVHTTADPAGAVRGQVIPVRVPSKPFLPF